ncbi:HAMP domain-containing protein [Myxococcota bacterium]|nr:HAMP domain-containing protein [Myxococcota bacterium]
MTIPGKVFAAFMALLFTFGGVSAYTVAQMSALSAQLAQLHDNLIPLAPRVAEIRAELLGLRLVLSSEDPDELRRGVRFATEVHPYLEQLRGGFAQVREGLEAKPNRASVQRLAVQLDVLERSYDRLQRRAARFFEQVERGEDWARPQRALLARLSDLSRALTRFDNALSAATTEAVGAFRREEDRVRWGVLLFAGVAMIVGVILSFGASRLLRPLGPLRAVVERIARGDYDTRAPLPAPGELGALAREVNRMAEAIQQRDARLREQQQALLHRERLATVGRMSSQITHELRNPLSSIGLNSELLMEELETLGAEMDGARSLLESITREVERLREITEAYLRFARLPRPERVPVNLNHAVTELLEFARGELEQARVRARLDPDPVGRAALVDPNQLRAALLNLTRNAMEALDDVGGGHLVVKVRSLGDAASVEIRDDGPGMSAEAMRHLFEPFFTTKAQGTGLGLSMVREIVQAQEGEVEVYSPPGEGTVVRLRLPLAEMEAGADAIDDL